VKLTAAGHAAFDAAMALQAPWFDGLANRLNTHAIATAHQGITTVGERLGSPAD
jgi:hypothetical protein